MQSYAFSSNYRNINRKKTGEVEIIPFHLP